MFLRQGFNRGTIEQLINLQQVLRIVRVQNVITIEYIPRRQPLFRSYTPKDELPFKTEEEAIQVFDDFSTQIRYGVTMDAANRLR
jgi:hypothetical protein